MKRFVGWSMAAAMMLLGSMQSAEAVYRKGCEFPLKDVQVCWEAASSMDGGMTPFPELHLLPITQAQMGQSGILVDYTRSIYRQLMTAGLGERFVQQWEPAFHLEEAVQLVQENDWPVTLWISPRVLRNSSAANPGLVDLDAYLLGEGGVVMRRMRVRVDAKPHVRKYDSEMATAMSTAVSTTGLFTKNPVLALTGVATGAALAKEEAPEAGYSLELMTELAARQVIFISQNAVGDLQEPPKPEEPNVFRTLLAHKQPPPDIATAADPMPSRPTLMESVSDWWGRNIMPAVQPRP
uniref:Lipoprotein n=1 Tax=Magnetococcus massalia (strain MO-1) TaxID=451514 RepID=A0A1S7LL04_MAGMO|nr:conserved exported protein of unknown function [Candidatus Magnetococcus massalia]